MNESGEYNRRRAIVIGLLATLIVCALFAAGLFARLTLWSGDLLSQHVPAIDACPKIVLVDIDDHALESIHAWPWPRRLHADMIDILRQAGVSVIALDIVMTEPTAPRVLRPDLHVHWDVDPTGEIVGDESVVVYDDDELAAAIARHGHVQLAMLCALSADEQGHRRRPGGGQSPDESARQQARRFLQANPAGAFPAFLQQVSGDQAATHFDQRRRELLEAFRRARADVAMMATLSSSHALKHEAARLPHASNWQPPIDKLSSVAAGFGLVSHRRDPLDGAVRDVPVGVRLGEGNVTLPALGLAAANAFSRRVAEGGKALVEPPEAAGSEWSSAERPPVGLRDIPANSAGLVRLLWQVPASDRADWKASFRHIPATRVMEIAQARVAIEANRVQAGVLWAEVLRERHAASTGGFADYAAQVRRRNELQGSLRLIASVASQNDMRAEIESLDQKLVAARDDARRWLAYQLRLEASDDESTAARARLRELRTLKSKIRRCDSLAALSRDLAEESGEQLAALREELQGSLCFVGYTATAVADLVPSPVFASVPGVMAHANLANMVVQDRWLMPPPIWLQVLYLLGVGWLMTTVVSSRGPAFSVVVLAVVLFGLPLLAAGIYASTMMQFDFVSGAVAAFAAWGGVTLYRQSTEARARRRFRRALETYTAPAVAARIAHRRGVADLQPRSARVTCFFCDLQGFTALSESLGPQATREVLNAYLQTVSEILFRQGAIVNKFIGDGVFAFFDAPIHPCPQRERAAALAAVACQAAAADLRGLSVAAGRAPDEPLPLRIGLATGEVFVGDYGSRQKLDYTCIGDTVNIAARLESANKVIGAGTLIDEATRAGLGEDWPARRIGRLKLVGKSNPVQVFQLLDPDDAAGADLLPILSNYDRALAAFEAGQWDAARQALSPTSAPSRAARTMPDQIAAGKAVPDAPSRWLLDQIERYEQARIDGEWDGWIEMQNK